MKLPYDPSCPPVGLLVNWSVGLPWFQVSHPMLLSEHLLTKLRPIFFLTSSSMCLLMFKFLFKKYISIFCQEKRLWFISLLWLISVKCLSLKINFHVKYLMFAFKSLKRKKLYFVSLLYGCVISVCVWSFCHNFLKGRKVTLPTLLLEHLLSTLGCFQFLDC